MTTGTMTLYIASSVDGFIASADGGVAWLEEFPAKTDAPVEGSYEEFFADIDCLVMGSTTYEQIREFGEWPYGQKPTYVVSSRELPLENEAITLFEGDLGELPQQLKRRYDHTWVVGGAQLAQSFLRSKAIDELRLSLIPGLLGSGIRLFADSDDTHSLELLGTTAYENGIAELHYRVVQ